MPSDLKRHNRAVAILAFLATVIALAITAPLAGAQLHPGSYTLATANYEVTGEEDGGGHLACPTGQRIVSGGAFWHTPGQGPQPSNAADDELGSSTPTSDGKGWYADGGTGLDRRLTITALCLPKNQVGNYTLTTDNLNVQANSTGGGYLACPTGQRIVAGGAYWHDSGQGPQPSDAAYSLLGSSTPTTDGRGWYADGMTNVARQLTITALCLPKQQLGTYTLKTVTLNTGASTTSVGEHLNCPKKQRIVTGGAFWHTPGQGPDPSASLYSRIGSSTPTTNGRGWYADGHTTGTTASPEQLTITALCLAA